MLKIKRATILEVLLIAIISFGFFPSIEKDKDNFISDNLNNRVITNVSKIIELLDQIKTEEKTGKLDTASAKEYYKTTRRYFKEIELYTEYYFPFYSKYFINGPLVNKAEFEYGNKTFTPHGFQVIEAILFDNDTTYRFQFEIDLLKQSLLYIKKNSSLKKASQAKFIDMIRFEIIRIASLYLNGYDSPANLNNINECVYIFEGFDQLLSQNFSEKETEKSKLLIKNVIAHLQKNDKYETL